MFKHVGPPLNDPMNGGDADSLAQGNQTQNGWDKMFYLAVGYYFWLSRFKLNTYIENVLSLKISSILNV